MSEHTECPFCNLNERVLKENKTAQAFLSNPRKVPGHFLVTPKRHMEKPWELTEEELKDIFELIFYIEQKLIGKVGDGVDIRQNYRPYSRKSNITVDHLLFHVVPRYLEDYLYKVAEQYEKDLFMPLDIGEAKDVAKLLEEDG